jgi:preprotein translocase subunit Sec63
LIIDRLNQSGVTDIEDGDRLDIYSDVNKLFSTIKDVVNRKQKQEAAKNKKPANRRRR